MELSCLKGERERNWLFNIKKGLSMDGAGTNGSPHGAKYRSMMELKVKVWIRL